MHGQTDRQANRKRDKNIDRQADRQDKGLMDRQAEKIIDSSKSSAMACRSWRCGHVANKQSCETL